MALAVRGPNVTPGYWRNKKATAEAFDADGFYSMGDAGRLINPDNPSEGLIFDGRTSENFKLRSGTWVNVNAIRVGVVTALKPYFLDAVITGHNQSEIGLLIVPNIERLAKQYKLSEKQQNAAHLQQVDEVVSQVIELLQEYNDVYFSNSTRIGRVAIIPEQPSIEKNEITDKGYLNQRALLESWSELIDKMYDEERQSSIYFHSF